MTGCWAWRQSRHCIGQPLARMNVATVLASLLAHLSFRLAEPVCLCWSTPWT